MNILIQNTRIWTEQKLTHFDEIVIVDGIWSPEKPEKIDRIIDFKNAIMMPALSEIHADFKEPGLEYVYNLKDGVEAMMKGGFDTALLSPATEPLIDNPATVEWVENKLQKFPVNVWLSGCLSLERKGKFLTEMVEMQREGCLALSEGLAPLSNSRFLRNALKYATQTGSRVHLLPMDAELGTGVMHAGALSLRYGISGISVQAEEIAVFKLICLAEMTQCPLHLKHITSIRSIQMIREAQAKGLDLTFDVTLNHLMFSDQDLETLNCNLKLMPPLRSEENRKLLLEAFYAGKIDVLSSQHTPVLPEFKNCPIDQADFGAVGLETALSVLWSILNGDVNDKVAQVQKVFVEGPRRVLGLEKLEIKVGCEISAVVFDDTKTIRFTPTQFAALVHNSPYLNKEFVGSVVALISQKEIHELN